MGYTYLYTGEGGGKTTNALGLALRAVGHGYTVVIIQFMKWWKEIGEYKIQKRLSPQYKIYQFGRKGWIGLGNLTQEDQELALEGLKFAEKLLEKDPPYLLILDEINLALHCNLLPISRVLALIKQIPETTTLVLTGRNASKPLMDQVDFVNEIIVHKSIDPAPATPGIQY